MFEPFCYSFYLFIWNGPFFFSLFLSNLFLLLMHDHSRWLLTLCISTKRENEPSTTNKKRNVNLDLMTLHLDLNLSSGHLNHIYHFYYSYSYFLVPPTINEKKGNITEQKTLFWQHLDPNNRKKRVLQVYMNRPCCDMYTVRNHTNEKQRCVEQRVVVILGLSVFKQQHI